MVSNLDKKDRGTNGVMSKRTWPGPLVSSCCSGRGVGSVVVGVVVVVPKGKGEMLEGKVADERQTTQDTGCAARGDEVTPDSSDKVQQAC